jgi:hypothetical protein
VTNPTYRNLLEQAVAAGDFTPLTTTHLRMTLAVSPFAGWFMDTLVFDQETHGYRREDWEAVQSNIAYLAAWMDAYVLGGSK